MTSNGCDVSKPIATDKFGSDVFIGDAVILHNASKFDKPYLIIQHIPILSPRDVEEKKVPVPMLALAQFRGMNHTPCGHEVISIVSFKKDDMKKYVVLNK